MNQGEILNEFWKEYHEVIKPRCFRIVERSRKELGILQKKRPDEWLKMKKLVEIKSEKGNHYNIILWTKILKKDQIAIKTCIWFSYLGNDGKRRIVLLPSEERVSALILFSSGFFSEWREQLDLIETGVELEKQFFLWVEGNYKVYHNEEDKSQVEVDLNNLGAGIGEYVIDLSKLPIFPKRPPISSTQLGYSEFKVREAEVRSKFLSLLLYRQEKKLKELPRKIKEPEEEKSEETKFLESLGIFGDSYYPGKTKTGDSSTSYQTLEVIGRVRGIPTDLYPNLRSFINTGSCKNAVISEALKDLAEFREEKDLEKLKAGLEKVEKEKKNLIQELRALKFRVISGKTLTFSDKQLERASVEIKEGVKVEWVVKDTEIEV